MKTHLFFYLNLSILLLSFSSTACTHKVKPNPSGEKPFYIYNFVEQPVLGTDQSQQLIEKFLGEKAPANLVKSDENIVYFTSDADLNTNLEQDLNTGNFTFNRGVTKYMGDYVPKLPSNDEAVKFAEQFLSQNDLQPKNASELKLVHQGGLRSSSVQDGAKQGQVIDKMITLTYGRIIDSLPVLGPGSKIVVNIGENGEVTGLVRRWRELNLSSKKQLEASSIFTQKEAEESARRQIAAEYGEKTNFTINNTFIAYYDNNGKILQPVYAFETTINLEDRNARPFNYLCVIPVMKNSPEPLQLITTDPHAKESIKNIKQGEETPGGSKDKERND